MGLPRPVQPDREDLLSGYEAFFLVVGSDFPLGGSLADGFIASSFFFAISA
jgi:hypothetical protein